MLTGFFVFFLFFMLSRSFIMSLLLFLSLSQMNRPIQVKPADSESRGGTVCPSLLLLLPPPLLPSFFCSNPTNMLPVHIKLTIICPIRRCPVPQRRLTAWPGQTLQYSEHIMLTVFFLAGVDPSSFLGVSSYALMHAHARTHTETCVSCHA